MGATYASHSPFFRWVLYGFYFFGSVSPYFSNSKIFPEVTRQKPCVRSLPGIEFVGSTKRQRENEAVSVCPTRTGCVRSHGAHGLSRRPLACAPG